MKNKRITKLFAVSCAAVMMFGCTVNAFAADTLSASVVQAEESVSQGFRFTENSDGTVTITGFSGTVSDLTIPASLNGKPVSSIGTAAFQYNTDLQSLVISKGINTIGYNAFAYCTQLKKLTLPDGLTEIGTAAFNGCKSLTYVELPKSLKEMKSYAFAGCRSLKSIVVPQSVTVLNFSVFESCSSLRYASVSGKLTKVYSNAFGHCTSLIGLRLPRTVTNIYGLAFCECTNMTNLTILSTNAQIDKVAFDSCPSLTIYGIKGSTAESIAKTCHIPFSDKTAPAYSLTTITPSVCYAGSGVTVKAKGVDGTAPYQYAVYYRKSDSTVWNKAQELSPNSTVTFTPKDAGSYIVKVRIKDGSGRITEQNTTIQVKKPLTNDSVISARNIRVGDTVRVIGKASGGQGTYQYSASYQLSTSTKWVKLLNYGKGISADFTPKKAGTYRLKIFVRDGAGKIVSKTFSVSVSG